MGLKDDASDLDALIEARRQGRRQITSPDSEPGRMAAVAGRLSASWQDAQTVDKEAVRARVAAGIAASPERSAPGWWARRPWSDAWAVPRRAALATAVVVAAGVLFSLIAPDSGSAAFVDHVQRLSTVTEAALADEHLSDSEKTELASLAAALVERVAAEPEALAGLDSEDLEAASSALGEVESRLLPHSEVQAVAPGASFGGASSEGPPSDVGAGLPATAPLVSPAPAVSASIESVRSVSGAVEEVLASRGRGPTRAPGHATIAAVCSEASGNAAEVCGAAVETAQEICGSVSDVSGLGACSAAVEVAAHNCDILQGADRAACRIALRDLEQAAAASLQTDGTDVPRGAGAENGRGRPDGQ